MNTSLHLQWEALKKWFSENDKALYSEAYSKRFEEAKECMNIAKEKGIQL